MEKEKDKEVMTEEVTTEHTDSIESGEVIEETDPDLTPRVENEQKSLADDMEALKEEIDAETSAEEAPAEEVPVEEVPAEEVPAEEASTEEEKPKKKVWRTILLVLAGIFGTVAVLYFGATIFFSNHFWLQTTVNGMNCAGMSVKKVDALMQEQVENYVLRIEGRDGKVEEISGAELDMQYNGIDVIDEAINEQNAFLWVVGFYEDSTIQATIDLDYNVEKLDAKIAELDCLKEENQVEPVSATPVYDGGEYVIQEEDLGTQIDSDTLSAAVHRAVSTANQEMSLHDAGCYVEPKYKKDSQEVIDATDAMNTCIASEITYSLADIIVEVEKEDIVEWISVDDEMQLKFNDKKMKKFIKHLAEEYNTPDSSQEITTPTGKVAKVPNGRKGRKVGQSAELKQLKKEIREGAIITREPALSQKATSGDNLAWGDTYVEVDLSQQHMWYIKNGEVVFQSDVVTGKPDGTHDTPAGLHQILEKLSPKVLTGYLPNGQLEYKTPVKYWLRVTWTGVGFHDATWQAAFGGNRYKIGYGSHGCINMPYGKVAELYGMVKKGCPVVIHY